MLTVLAALVAQTGTVTLEYAAIPVGKAVQEIARQSGQLLECSPEVWQEPITIGVENQDTESVLRKLAAVAAARWRTKDQTRILERPNELQRELEAAERGEIQKRVEAIIAEELKAVSSQPPLDEKFIDRVARRDWPQSSLEAIIPALMANQNRSPGYQAAVKWLSRTGAARLCKMDEGSRMVFTDNPNAAQSKLPDKGEIKSLLEAIRTIDARLESQGNDTRHQAMFDGFLSVFNGGPSYGRTLLVVQRLSAFSFQIDLTVTSRAGKAIAVGQWTMPNRLLSRLPVKANVGQKVTLSQESLKIADLMSDLGVQEAGSMGQNLRFEDGTTSRQTYYVTRAESLGLPPDFGVSAITSKPDENDPIGYVFGPLLLQAGKNLKVPVMGTCADSALTGLSLRARGLSTDEVFLATIGQWSKVERDDGWLTVRPGIRWTPGTRRLNRRAMRDYLDEVAKSGRATILRACKYHAVNPTYYGFFRALGPLLSHSVLTVDRMAIENSLAVKDPMVALGGASGELQPFQRALGTLPPAFQKAVAAAPMTRPDTQDTTPGPDPTDLYPNGIPSDTMVTLTVEEQLAIEGKNSQGIPRWATIASYVWEEKRTAESPRPERKYALCRPGTLRIVTIQVATEPPIVLSASEYLPLPGATFMAPDKLPREYSSKLEEASKKIIGSQAK